MNERESLKRKIRLNTQAIKLIRGELKELRTRLFLLKLRESLEWKMKQDFDRELSAKIDCIDFLLGKKS